MRKRYTFQQALSKCTVEEIGFENYYGDTLTNRNKNIIIISANKDRTVLINTSWYRLEK